MEKELRKQRKRQGIKGRGEKSRNPPLPSACVKPHVWVPEIGNGGIEGHVAPSCHFVAPILVVATWLTDYGLACHPCAQQGPHVTHVLNRGHMSPMCSTGATWVLSSADFGIEDRGHMLLECGRLRNRGFNIGSCCPYTVCCSLRRALVFITKHCCVAWSCRCVTP